MGGLYLHSAWEASIADRRTVRVTVHFGHVSVGKKGLVAPHRSLGTSQSVILLMRRPLYGRVRVQLIGRLEPCMTEI